MGSGLPPISAIVGVLTLTAATSAGCALVASDAGDGIPPETVRTDWEVAHATDGPPVAVDVRPLSPDDDGWAVHDVVLRGAQIEYVVDLDLPSRRFEAIGGDLQPIEPDPTVEPVRLGFDGRVKLEVVVPEQLPPGRHTFDLVVATWINRDAPAGEPDDRIVITLGYNVQDPSDRLEAEAFCAEAVPLTNGRRPSLEDLDRISVLAAAELGGADLDDLTPAVGRLRRDLGSFEAGTGDGFSVDELNSIIGRICNIDMESESVES